MTSGPGNLPDVLKPQIMCVLDFSALPLAKKIKFISLILPPQGCSHVEMGARAAGLEGGHQTSRQARTFWEWLQYWREKNPKRHPRLIRRNGFPLYISFTQNNVTSKATTAVELGRGDSKNPVIKTRPAEQASSLRVFASKQCFEHLHQFVTRKMCHTVCHLLPTLAFPLIAVFQCISRVNIWTLCRAVRS